MSIASNKRSSSHNRCERMIRGSLPYWKRPGVAEKRGRCIASIMACRHGTQARGYLD